MRTLGWHRWNWPSTGNLGRADVYIPPRILAGVSRRLLLSGQDPAPRTALSPAQAMELAMTVALRGTGRVAPNPLVGCTLVDARHRLLSVGHHARLGEAHAEPHAVNKVTDLSQLRGGTAYVTLEPCAHQGRTPPCAPMLAKLGLQEVVYGVRDPNPKVDGRGAEILRAAGVKASLAQEDPRFSREMREDLETLNEIFVCNQVHKRPFVAVKLAQSLDGKMALPNGESQWLTGPRARRLARGLRAYCGATLIGRRTLHADNPILDARETPFADPCPKVIVMDPSGRGIEPHAKIFSVRSGQDVFWVMGAGVSGADLPGAQNVPRENWIRVPSGPMGHMDLSTVLNELWSRGITAVLVEGGAFTIARWMQSGLVDRLYAFTASVVLGEGLSWTEGLKIDGMKQARRLTHVRSLKLSPDHFVTGRLPRRTDFR